MCGKTSYEKESFLFTTIFTGVIVIGYMISRTILPTLILSCLPFFIASTALMLVKAIIVSHKGKWRIQEIMSEVLLLIYSMTFYIPFGLIALFSEQMGTVDWSIFLNYLIFIPANLIIYFGYLWLKTLYYRFTGKTIDEDSSLKD